MKRNVSLSEISDGRLYGLNDMVKADCRGCRDCCDCCKGMGSSVILDPYDVFRLTCGLGKTMEELLCTALELNVVDGVVLPNLKMSGREESCFFLNREGRCSIHSLRPGICRLFPLGRYYEDGGFQYFLQTKECSKQRTKVKVSKWIDEPQVHKNREFVLAWHELLKQVEAQLLEKQEDEFCKKLNMLLLDCFYLKPYGAEGFYEQFADRCREFNQRAGRLLLQLQQTASES